ncbi:BamA/TamA family outer membrane protein [Hymenobacter sp. BT770]|uniref:translocation and assembly module lipoprotein TamL n=1 Tax=Hymenobacter sp. BT770 TaxID=2886942 RepID=UPI001D105B05|nr:BamA/TamA family outer membrane protein [Hymenobacter sp. BT770]MCC3152945.1 outer membrane protein assembly factor [Hymenobacter sp. BT770]MDO3415141.1 BamA/TamA family outer membrane protein [Hymenobacter sp. BT770]
MKPLLSKNSSKLRPGRWLSWSMAPVLGLWMLAACSPFSLLRPGQRLLSRVELKGVEQADKERLTALVQQNPNTRFPLPKLGIYQLGHRFYDSARIKSKMLEIQTSYDAQLKAAGTDSAKLGKLLAKRERKIKRKQLALDKGNAIMRLGESPAVYDSALTRKSVEQMTTYLRTQGFFRARVTATDTAQYRRGIVLKALMAVGSIFPGKPDTLDAAKRYRRVTVTYNIIENQPFRYRLQPPSIPDSGVAKVVRDGQAKSLLHDNERYNEEQISAERLRLETLLKNAGYYDFRQQYITLEADTSYEPLTVRLRTLIANPAPGQGHRVYSVRQVRFVTDAGVGRTLRAATGDTLRRAGTLAGQRRRPSLGVRTDTVVTDSVHFAAYEQKYSTRLLARKVMVRPGQRFSLDRTIQTQHLLADLDMFRFNTVNYRKVPDLPSADSAGVHPPTGELIAVINASPAPKFAETSEVGGTYIATKAGPFLNLRLKTRNPFGGAEVLELGVRAGLEGQLTRVADSEGKDTPESVYTRQLGATAALVLPQFLVPFNTNRFLTRYNPKTRLSLSETFVQRPEYTRSNFEFAFDYIWQRSLFHQYVFSPVVITLVNTIKQDDLFKARLIQLRDSTGSSLYRSFSKQIEPSMSFTSLYNSNDFNQTRDAKYLRLFVEVGGLTRGLYKDNLFSSTGLNVYDFARFSADYRRYHHLTPNTFFVWRLNGGVVHALTRTDDPEVPGYDPQYIIPYDKSYFAGGSTSLRAWQPRKLGPGGYSPTRITKDGSVVRDFLTEQPGELLLEGSAEYRFPIYGFIKGAFFTDFGNVWGLQERKGKQGEYLRPGAQFQLNTFYKQIAVGSGMGIRFDFTFLIIRLDIATKIYDPTAPGADRWALRNFDSSANPIAFNLGIGYPF